MREQTYPTIVVLRASWQRRLFYALAPPAIGVVVPSFLSGDRQAWHPSDVAIAVVFWAGFIWFSLWLQGRNRVELRAGELYVRSGWRPSTIRAAAIEDITIERQLGGRLVTIWMRHGERRRLPTAGRTEGLVAQHFDRDLAVVRQWWSVNRTAEADAYRLAYGPISDFDWRPHA